jgi:Tat protein secretion system quality control protein TatD with DNase activity
MTPTQTLEFLKKFDLPNFESPSWSLHDTHAHLEMLLQRLNLLPEVREYSEENLDLKELPEPAKTVLNDLLQYHSFILQSTVSTNNFIFTHNLFSYNSKVKFFLGSHPEIVNENFDLETYLQEQKLAIESHQIMDKVVGIGEIGLDYFYTQDPKLVHTQKQLFESQIQLAIDYNKPIMIHCRDACYSWSVFDSLLYRWNDGVKTSFGDGR